MFVSKTVRLAALTALAAFAACGESPIAPETAAKRDGIRPPYDAAGPSFNLLGSGDHKVTLTINPNVDQFHLVGANWIYIPAGSVCDLETSGYGNWEAPCAPETQSFTAVATASVVNGHTALSLDKDFRFRPTSDPYQAAYLFMRESSLDLTNKYGVLWQNPKTGALVNEAATDKSLRTFRVNGLWVGRRIKHFSGYNVTLGREHEEQCDPTVSTCPAN